MEIRILEKEEIDKEVANIFIDLIKKNSHAVLGLATGSTPIGVYSNLVKAYKNHIISFNDVKTFNLDEYLGLDGTNEQSYRYFMNYHLFNHIDIKMENTHVPLGIGDVDGFIKKYDEMIKSSGGIDIQLLGLGSDCHIAFNEPGTSFSSLTHVTKIEESTILDNARFFASKEEVPTMAVTMGLKSIMNARKIILIATGKNKAQAVYDLVNKEPDVKYPGTVLKDHQDCIIFLDKEAASLLK